MKRTAGTASRAPSPQPAPAKKSVKSAQPAAQTQAKAARTTKTDATISASASTPKGVGATKKSAAAKTGMVAEVAALALAPADEKLLKRLKEERERLVRQAGELDAERRALAEDPEAAEMNSDLESGDCMATVEREKDVHLSGQIHDLLFRVDKAIRKLRSGTYGICESCKSAIPKARLAALPYAELCVSCQQKMERLQI